MRLAPIALVLLFSIVATAVLGGKIEDLAKEIDGQERVNRDRTMTHKYVRDEEVKARLGNKIKENKKEINRKRKELRQLASEAVLPVDPKAPHGDQIERLKKEIASVKYTATRHVAYAEAQVKSGLTQTRAERTRGIVETERAKGNIALRRDRIRELSRESGIPHDLSPSPPSSPEPRSQSPPQTRPDSPTGPLPSKRRRTSPDPPTEERKPPHMPFHASSLAPSASGGSRAQLQTDISTGALPFRRTAPPPSSSFGYIPPIGFNQPHSHISQVHGESSRWTPTPPGFQTAGALPPPPSYFGIPSTTSFDQHHLSGPPPSWRRSPASLMQTPPIPYAPANQLPLGPPVHQSVPPTSASRRTGGDQETTATERPSSPPLSPDSAMRKLFPDYYESREGGT